MNINKDNYEEYFLLFADNELSQSQKSMVEAFVEQHPELEEEFISIKQSVLTPESDLTLEDKKALFRHTKKLIDHTNYEEIFVRYIDNELTSQERHETEIFLSDTPALKKELEAFERTKLQPDKTIVFPNKKLLLKREDTGRIVPFRWWKLIAAAAVLIGFGLWAVDGFLNVNKIEQPLIVKKTAPETKGQVRFPAGTTATSPISVVAKSNLHHGFANEKTLPGLRTARTVVKTKHHDPDLALKKQSPTNDLPVINDLAINNRHKQSADAINKKVAEIAVDNTNVKQGEDNRNNLKLPKEDGITMSSRNDVPNVVSTSYAADESENNSNYAFYNISEEKFNKSKVGGFLRKVKRIIERKISPFNNLKNQREVAVN